MSNNPKKVIPAEERAAIYERNRRLEDEVVNGFRRLPVQRMGQLLRTLNGIANAMGSQSGPVPALSGASDGAHANRSPVTENNSGQGTKTNVVPRKEGKPPIVVPHESLRSVPFIALLSEMNREERATAIGVNMNRCTSILFAAWRRCWVKNQGDEEACLQAWNAKFGGNDNITTEIIEDVRNSFDPKGKKKTGEVLGESTRIG
jgi:hypothetical protein